jgi:hypothetical protein
MNPQLQLKMKKLLSDVSLLEQSLNDGNRARARALLQQLGADIGGMYGSVAAMAAVSADKTK